MVESDMMHKRSHFAKTFIAALCLSASAAVPASAAQVTFLPDISADQIAKDTVRSYDSRTGVSVVTAPTFDPFEQDNTLAGSAALRTGPSETTIDGRRVSGGAFLDLKMIYTSPSDDPYDLRGFERSFFVSGEPVDRIRQETRTLDCSANTSDVVYQDDYYSGFDNYGYLAGLYLLLPQYRGHRGYWSGGSRYRPSAGWSDWRRRGGIGKFGGYGGGYYSGHGYAGNGYSGNGFNGSHDGRGNGGREGSTGNTGRNSGGNSGENNRRSERHNGNGRVIGGSNASREYRGQRGVVTGGPLQTSRGSNRASTRAKRRNERAARRSNARENQAVRRSTGRANAPIASTTSQPIARTGRPAIRETISNRRANPAGAPPAPIARQSQPRPISRPAPIQRPAQRPVQRSEPRADRKSSPRAAPKPRAASRRLNREVDRSFRNKTRAQRGKTMQFFPQLGQPMLGGYARTQTVVTNYRCVREETVTLHIPQERLDAARFDGMTLVVVDNADRDVPVYLPPNYIEGFRRASGRQSGSQTGYQSGSYAVPSTTVVTPQPSYQGRYPQN